MKILGAVFALAAMAHGAQERAFYEYDDLNNPYWSQENSLATDRFSHHRSMKRQFLDLIGEGVPAAFLFSAAGVSKCLIDLGVLLYFYECYGRYRDEVRAGEMTNSWKTAVWK